MWSTTPFAEARLSPFNWLADVVSTISSLEVQAALTEEAAQVLVVVGVLGAPTRREIEDRRVGEDCESLLARMVRRGLLEKARDESLRGDLSLSAQWGTRHSSLSRLGVLRPSPKRLDRRIVHEWERTVRAVPRGDTRHVAAPHSRVAVSPDGAYLMACARSRREPRREPAGPRPGWRCSLAER